MLNLGVTVRHFGRVAALALALSAGNAWSGDQDFTVHNQTGVDIYELYVSPGSSNDWEEDVLGVDVLADGDSVDITFDREETSALWDLQVRDSEGNSLTWTQLNLLEISELTLHYENGEAWAEAE